MSAPLRDKVVAEPVASERPESELLIETAPPAGWLIPVGGLAVRRPLRRSGAVGSDPDPLGGTAIPAPVVERLRRRAGGRPLPVELQGAGSTALGRDLSHVRVHTDPEAAELTDSMQARAFTYGQDIYFSGGAFRPGEDAGQRLIAHELGHIGQDPAAADGVIGRADDPAEAAADRAAAGVLAALRRQAAVVGRPAGDRPAAPDQAPLAALRRQSARTIRRGWIEPFTTAAGVALGVGANSMLGGGGLGAAAGAVVGGLLGYGIGSWPPQRSWTAVGATDREGPSRWLDKGWKVAPGTPQPPAAAAGTLPAPSSRGKTCDWGVAGYFVVNREWNPLPGPGFILQHIRRKFDGVWFMDGNGLNYATDRTGLENYVSKQTFANLNYDEVDYWELFPVKADGLVAGQDQFASGSIVPKGRGGRRQWKDTSGGTYVQTGTAYYVSTNRTEAQYQADLGMKPWTVKAANGLATISGINMLRVLANNGYPAVSPVPCVFDLKVSWDTRKMLTDSQNDSLGFVTINIVEH